MDDLKEHLSYSPTTGEFVWLKPLSPRVQRGSIASYIDKDGYRGLRFKKKYYRAHRLAFYYMMDRWPEYVDHIDGDKLNNSWMNLRESNAKLNAQNQRKARSDSSTGVLGIAYYAGKYSAYIGIDNKTNYLGRYNTKEEAHQAYVNAKRILHEHGTL